MDTVFPADSLEFCPSQGAQDVFVCGTYKLDEPRDHLGDSGSPQHRRGQCLVFRTEDERVPSAYVWLPMCAE